MFWARRAVANITLVSALALFAMSAAGSNAVASDMTMPELEVDQYAVDGADFYWTRASGRNKSGCPTKTQVLRRDLLGGANKVIGSFHTSCDVEAGWLEAGGGRVAIQRYTGRFDGYDTKVFSMDRNGSAKRVLASGSMRGDSIYDRPTAACGNSVAVVSGSPTGAFVISRFTQESTVKRCGQARTVTTGLYEAVSPEGTRRKIYSQTGKFKLTFGQRPLERVVLNGDYAALVKSGTRRVHLADLNTGSVTGPLLDSVSMQGRKIVSIGVSVGPLGQVLINAPRPSPIDAEGYMATDLFPNPINLAAVVRKYRDGATWYCGARLLSERLAGEFDNFGSLVELDAQTLDVKRVIARVPASGSDIEGCSSSAITLSSETNSGDLRLHAVALGD